MEEFIEEFKAEATAIIENLQALLVSYADSTVKLQTAEEVFRGIHTLKGTAKMFGFDRIESVTHQLENILDEHRTKGIPFNPDFTETVLRTLDFCLLALTRKESSQTLSDIIAEIEQHKVLKTADVEDKTEKGFCILFKPDSDVFARGVNVASMLDELKAMGHVKSFYWQENVKSIDDQVAAKQIDGILDIWVITNASTEEVHDVFMFFKSYEFCIIPIDDASDLEHCYSTIEAFGNRSLNTEERAARKEFVTTHLQPPARIAEEHDQHTTDHTPTPEKNDAHEAPKLSYINVPLSKLDQMMNLVSEFITLSSEVKFYASVLKSDGLNSVSERLEKVSTNFRDQAFNLRLVPIQILAVKLQRYVKDLSEKLGKKVRFITEGMDTEIDKSIINQIEGPLMHIIRNALDHGIETPAERLEKGKNEEGILKLSAFYSGTNAFIHIQDDGAGINHEKVKAKAIEKGIISATASLTKEDAVNLIFKPGFTTAQKTTEISGRGVGMDVVQNNIRELRGSIEVSTEEGLGTSFALRLPLALSIMDVMIIKVAGLNFMVPNAEIEFCTAASFKDQVQRKGFNLLYKNNLIPFIDLGSAFHGECSIATDKSILIINKNDRLVAVEMDEIIGKEPVVIKPIDETLQIIPYLSGTSVLGNGELAFLIDVLKLKELYAC